VHVLENQHDRLKFAEQVQQLEYGLEQAKLAGGLELVERRMTGAYRRPQRSQ